MVTFVQLNNGWNADPNAPEPVVSVDGADLLVSFFVNAFQFAQFAEGTKAILRFRNYQRYRIGPTNDEGWYMGKCRFSRLAPKWGEFYQVYGDTTLLLSPSDWSISVDAPIVESSHHYLFYFRDETFECLASDWEIESPANPSTRTSP